MSFIEGAYPIGDFTTKQGKKDDNKYSGCNITPTILNLILKKTPMGVVAFKKIEKSCLERFLKRGKPQLEISIQREQLRALRESKELITDHGRTFMKSDFGLGSGVKMEITYYDIKDRMEGWSDDERLLIISIHEAAHIRYEKKKIKIDGLVSGTKFVNDSEGFWNKNHIKAFKKEFMARIEYSLLYKEEESTVSKDNWLDRYYKLFEIFQRFFVDPLESEEKHVRSIKRKAKIDLSKKLGVKTKLINSSNIPYDENQDFTTFISEINNHELGKQVCFKMYKKVVSNFENISVTVKNELSQKTLDKIREVLKEKSEYKKDVNFEMIK